MNNHPAYIQEIWKQIYNTNETYDFIEGSSIKKLRFSRFFPITQGNAQQFKNTTGVIVYNTTDKDYKFISEYTIQEKIPYSKLESIFKTFITPESNYVLEDGSYHSYIFQKFQFLDDTYGVYISDLEKLWLSLDSVLLYRNEENKYTFIQEYTKKKLISASIINGIPDKYRFLEHVRDDKRELSVDTDELFSELKSTTRTLVWWKSQQEKIDIIYDWVLNNIQYTTRIDLEDEKIFSWIDTYKNGDGVCTGYSKLTSYMLMFAGIHDTEVIRGDVIDAPDFPQIGHAWLRIGDRYYDPTFDDPVWAIEDKTPDEYKYYNLPRDLLYTNRFNRGDTPEAYKSLSLKKRQDVVSKRLFNISESYENNSTQYVILRPTTFRKNNNLSYDTQITPEVLSSIVPVYNVLNNSFSFTQGNQKRSIKNLRYFVLDNATTENVLATINYDLTDTFLFNWETENGNSEYRLAYDLRF